jgi:hypothetical protein
LYYRPLTFSDAQRRRVEQKTTKLHLTHRRYILAFNPELAALTHRHRQERVTGFRDWIASYNRELGQALGHRSRTVIENTLKHELKRRRLTDVPIVWTLHPRTVTNRNARGQVKRATTYTITLNEISSADYAKSRRYDGLWMVVTNLSSQDEAALIQQTEVKSCCDIYRMRQKIEESFRILSDVVGLEPFHVYTTEHIKAHFTICMLSYLLDLSMLSLIRKSQAIENMDLHRVFHQLNACKQDCIELDDTTAVLKLTHLTEEQRTLLKVLKCEYLVLPEYLQRHQIVSDYTKRA